MPTAFDKAQTHFEHASLSGAIEGGGKSGSSRGETLNIGLRVVKIAKKLRAHSILRVRNSLCVPFTIMNRDGIFAAQE